MQALLAVLVGTLLLASAGFAGATATARPSLQLLDLDPLTVRGRSFKPRERVKLLVSAGGVASRVVRAGTRGGFTARFSLAAGKCVPVVVQAIGNRGSRAMIDVTQPSCSTP